MPTIDYAEQNKKYEQLAIDLARGLANSRMGGSHELAVSHWNLSDEHVDRHGFTKAACGLTVKEELISGDPSCEPCRAACQAYTDLHLTDDHGC